MACCVVFSRCSQDVRSGDSSDKTANSPEPSHSLSNLNPDRTSCRVSKVASVVRQESTRDNDSVSESVKDFQEPRGELLSQARNNFCKSGARVKDTRNQFASLEEDHGKGDRKSATIKKESGNQATPPKGNQGEVGSKSETNKKESRKQATSSKENKGEADIVNILEDIEIKPLSRRLKSKAKDAICQKKQDSSCKEPSTSQGRKGSDTKRPCAARGRKRASSEEWNDSGSDSADTAGTDSRKKKQSVSSDPDWASDQLDDDSSEDELNDSYDSSHKCSVCGMTFNRPWRLKAHSLQHATQDKRPFKCDKKGCSKGYFYRQHLERHVSRRHADIVIVTKSVCAAEGCNRIFETSSGYKRHFNKMHSDQKLKFQCTFCDQNFSKNKQLRYHIAEHMDQPPLRCEKCNAGAYSKNEMRRHMRTHKEYKCDVPGCEKVFTNYIPFQKHLTEHNRCFNRLICAHCEKEFKTKCALRDHVMIHLEKKEKFQCPYDSCPRFYYHSRNLKSHIRVRHEKSCNFVCKWQDCDMQFLSRRALTRHINVHKYGIAPFNLKESPRALRKDKGVPKRAMASKLTGLVLTPDLEHKLLTTEPKSEENDTPDPTLDCLDWKSHLKNVPITTIEVSPQTVHCGETSQADLDTNSSTSLLTDFSPVNSDLKSVEQILSIKEGQKETSDEFNQCLLPIEEGDNVLPIVGTFVIGEEGVLLEVQEDGVDVSPDCANTDPHPHSKSATTLFKNSTVIIQDDYEAKVKEDNATSSLGFIENREMCNLSATLCAETIVECPSFLPEREVLLLIPKGGHMPSSNEVLNVVDSDAVVKALRGDVDVYSVVGNDNADLAGSSVYTCSTGTTHQEILKKISVDDPFVTSILQPFIQNLTCKPNNLDNELNSSTPDKKSTELLAKRRVNPGYLQELKSEKNLSDSSEVSGLQDSKRKTETENLDTKTEKCRSVKKKYGHPAFTKTMLKVTGTDTSKCVTSVVPKDSEVVEVPAERKSRNIFLESVNGTLSGFIHNNFMDSPLQSASHLNGRSVLDNLEGSSQDPSDSNSSSAIESNESQSDSSSNDGPSDSSGDEEDGVDDGGDGGNEEDGEGEDDEADEQSESEDDEDQDDTEGDGTNDSDQLNANNNNNDAGNSDFDSSARQVDHDLTNGHGNIGNGDLGVNHAASQKKNVPDESGDDVYSTHSDCLIIDDDKFSSGECSPPKVHERALDKKPPETTNSPEQDYPTCRRRSTRLRQLEVIKLNQSKSSVPAVENVENVQFKWRGVKKVDSASTLKPAIVEVSKNKMQIKKRNKVTKEEHQGKPEAEEKEDVNVTQSETRKTKARRRSNGKEGTAVEASKTTNQNGGSAVTAAESAEKTSKNKRRRAQSKDLETSSSSSSELSPPKRRRRNCISDDDSDYIPEETPNSDSDVLQISVKSKSLDGITPLKKSTVSPQEIPDSLHIALRKAASNALDSLNTVPKTSIACRQLSESAWIRVLRQASQAMKISLTAAED